MPTDVRIISDTHGLLRPEAESALEGADLILHAGDVGRPEILNALKGIAPVECVRGNVDGDPWAEVLPLTTTVTVDGVIVYMIHDRADLLRHPPPENCGVIVYGHSHRPLIEIVDGLLYLNPGSAGPRRFSLPVTMARLAVRRGIPEAEIVDFGLT